MSDLVDAVAAEPCVCGIAVNDRGSARVCRVQIQFIVVARLSEIGSAKRDNNAVDEGGRHADTLKHVDAAIFDDLSCVDWWTSHSILTDPHLSRKMHHSGLSADLNRCESVV